MIATWDVHVSCIIHQIKMIPDTIYKQQENYFVLCTVQGVIVSWTNFWMWYFILEENACTLMLVMLLLTHVDKRGVYIQ